MSNAVISRAASFLAQSLSLEDKFDLASAVYLATTVDEIKTPWKDKISKLIEKKTSFEKHGEHDQSSHGSWATGNFDEETEGEGAQGNYFERYGFDIKTGEPTGISIEGVRALDFYTGDGFLDINNNLRFGPKGDRVADERVAEIISDMDKLIDDAPEMFGDKNLFRVFDKSITDTLEVGDVLTDKGFMSTTRVDITREEGLDVLQNLQMIRTTNDTTAILLPSESKSGKGLAVDYVKNAVSDLFENVSTPANEKEVLLPRNTSLKFMGYNNVVSGEGKPWSFPMKVAVFQRMDK